MPLTGALLDARYLVGPLLGRGGMADVYRADDVVDGRAVAIKVLRAQRPADVRRFATEAEVLGRLDHPAIVRFLGSGTHDGVPYLVLELVEGEPLSLLLGAGPLGADHVAALGTAVASGLAHAHTLGVTHRDVKPGNVLIDSQGQPHLADFGIARLVGGDALTTTGQVLGTACYLAPEQVQGREVGPAADVYSLGLVLIEALSARRPFDGSGSEAALARLHRDPAIPGDAPPWLAQALTAMTAREPTRRPDAAVAADVLATRSAAALGAVTARVPVSPPTEVLTAPPVGSGPSRPYVRWLAAAVAAVGLVVVVLLAFLGGEDGVPDPAATVTTDPTTTTVASTTAPTTTEKPDKDDDNSDGDKSDKSDNEGRGGGGDDD